MELDITQEILLYGFGLAIIMGAVVNKTNFCTMGAVSDLVNMGDMSRMRAWLLAIVVAMLGLTTIEYIGLVDLDALDNSQLRPPYRMATFDWFRYIL
ncbi:MAG: YeeE/YedE thiosulfate transporter family protein, partial [Thiohalomonadales bacterium]